MLYRDGMPIAFLEGDSTRFLEVVEPEIEILARLALYGPSADQTAYAIRSGVPLTFQEQRQGDAHASQLALISIAAIFPGMIVFARDGKTRRDAPVSFARPHDLVRLAPRKSSSKIRYHLFHGLHAG